MPSMSPMLVRLGACIFALLLSARAVETDNTQGSELLMEVNMHHFAMHHSSDKPSRVMRRQASEVAGSSGHQVGSNLGVESGAGLVGDQPMNEEDEEPPAQSGTQPGAPPAQSGTEQSSGAVEGEKNEEDEPATKEEEEFLPQRAPTPAPPPRTADAAWGDYRWLYTDGTRECKEEGVKSWEGKSLFEPWAGTDSGLTMTVGTTGVGGVMEETPKGMRIYKAACPNATTVIVGGRVGVPVGTQSIDVVFGITRKCTGDCAHFMVSVLDYLTNEVKYRWCWNREGENPKVKCDKTYEVPFLQWNRAQLNLSNISDFIDPIKVSLETYTAGDFRLLPALPGEGGLGGRAMVLIDTLVFGPAERPEADSTYKDEALFCRQSMRAVCGENSWCMDKYRCHSGWCIEGKGRCNGERNCKADDSDEVGCEYKNGFHGEFYLNHARFLHKGAVKFDSLKNPDIRTLNEDVEYDAVDFWNKLHVRDNFAVRWKGNFTVVAEGHYYFHFNSSGTCDVEIKGVGNPDKNWTVVSGEWIEMPSGDYEMNIEYVHLTGEPDIVMKFEGPDTQGLIEKLGRDRVAATMTGSRCDTMMCNEGDGLVPKPGYEKLLCATVPCNEAVDTATCCTRQYKVVSAGSYRTCALDMLGRPICWGSWQGFNEEWKKHPGPFIDISTRDQYICAVMQDSGGVDCWRPDDGNAPLVKYSPGGNFKNISVGGAHVCALRDTGATACTGSSVNNEIYPPSGMFSRVSAGESFTCGISVTEHTMKCWGANEYGQASPPCMDPDEPCPNAHDYTMYTHLSAGQYHACGISNNTAYCWGWNNDGQATPPAGHDFSAVTAGGRHSCALKDKGQAACWGANEQSQSDVPEDDAPFLTITAGRAHTCAIRASDHEVVCWGSNFEVEPADGSSAWRGQSSPPPAGIWPGPAEP